MRIISQEEILYLRGIPEYAALLCFLSGCITIFFSVLHLGFLVEFVSIPVVSGFTSAASVIIACSQIKGLLGLDIHGEGFIEIWWELINHIADTKIPDLILSCCCILVLLVLKVRQLFIVYFIFMSKKRRSCVNALANYYVGLFFSI